MNMSKYFLSRCGLFKQPSDKGLESDVKGGSGIYFKFSVRVEKGSNNSIL